MSARVGFWTPFHAGTLIQRLMAEKPGAYSLSVSHTTRDPRKGEVDGVSYHFTTKDEFKNHIEAGGFVEYATIASEPGFDQRQTIFTGLRGTPLRA